MNIKVTILTALFCVFTIFRCDLQKPEQEEPEVSIKSPLNNSFVYEIVSITAEASDNKGIVYVEFYIDGKTDSSMMDMISPYTYDWNTLNLPDSSIHTIFAKAVDTDDNISSSEMITVTVNNNLAIPEPVIIETPVIVTDSSVTLKWSENANEDFNHYRIYRDTSTYIDFNSNHIVTIYEDTVTQYIDYNVLDNMDYKYVIYIFDDFNFYSKSNEVSANIPNREPEPVTLYDPSYVTDSTMTITWSASQIHDFQKYCLYRSLSDNPDNTSNVVFEIYDKYDNVFTDTGLETNVVYFYRLGLYDTGDLFSLSNIVSDTAKTHILSIPMEGLVAYYPFNGNANDESGNGNNGTVYGATPTTDRLGNENNAYSFDGVDDFIDLSSHVSNFIGWNTGTITGWFKKSILSLGGAILCFSESSTHSNFVYNVLYSRDNEDLLHYSIRRNCDNCNQLTMELYNENHLLCDDVWHHFAIVTGSGSNKIYVDGNENYIEILNGSTSTNEFSNILNADAFTIGALKRDSEIESYINSKIDDICIYNRALTESEIQALYYEE